MSKKPTVEQWLTIRKEAALNIDPNTAEVDWSYAQHLILTGSVRTCPRNASKLEGNTSPVLRQVMCGCGLGICRPKSAVPYGCDLKTNPHLPAMSDSF